MDTTADLAQRLSSFSVSSTEEKLTNRLSSAHLNPRPAHALFGGTAANDSKTGNAPPATTGPPVWAAQQDQKEKNDDEDGWGDLPSVHSGISQDYQFGFNSILSSTYMAEPKQAVAPDSGFGRFQHAPVSFTSAAASHSPSFGIHRRTSGTHRQ